MSRPDSLGTHMTRWQYALNGRQRLTREMWIDRLILANKGWAPEELQALWGQNREPSNYPILHPVVESICGMETQSRRDTVILARIRAHMDSAEALTALNKYVDQQNLASHVRSKVFRDAIGADGAGIMEVSFSDNPMAEPIAKNRVDAMSWWVDPAGREDDLSDYQDVFRARWVSRAWVDMRFKNARTGSGEFAAVFRENPLNGIQDYRAEHGDEPPVALFNNGMGGDPNYGPGHGLRAPVTGWGWALQDSDQWLRIDRYQEQHLLVERWYRADEWAMFAKCKDDRVIECTDATAATCARLALSGQATLVRAIARRVRCAIFVADGNGGLLQDIESPYKHGRFPFAVTWGYRDEEGQPFGVVRLLRDAAREFNMRRTHLTKRSLMRQVQYEEGAFVDEDDAIREIAKYNGVVRVSPGGLERFRVESNASVDAGAAMLEDKLLGGALSMVQNLGPVNQEALGQQTNAHSGVAIEQRQQQTQVALAHLFDNRNYAQQIESEMTLSMMQQEYTMEKEIRITGSSRGVEYLQVNAKDPTTGADLNNITQGRFDVIVEEQPEAQTARAMKLQALAQLMQGADIPPPVRMQTVLAIAEAQDLPIETLEALRKAAEMTANPQPQEAAPRKTLDEIVKIDLKDLTPSERAQVLGAVGIKADPEGPQAPAQPAPALTPQDALKAQQADAQRAHDAQMAQAAREHQLTLAHMNNEHKSIAAQEAADRAAQQAQATGPASS